MDPETLCTLYACIGGDHRYSTALSARYLPATGMVEVDVVDSSPSGGMDSDTPSLARRVFQQQVAASGPGLVALLRRAIAASDTLTRYGKPSKRLCWSYGIAAGLSTQRALDALRCAKAVARERADG